MAPGLVGREDELRRQPGHLAVTAATEPGPRRPGRRLGTALHILAQCAATEPTLVLWAADGPLDTWYADAGGPLGIWRRWTVDLTGHAVRGGHFFAEANPDATVAALDALLSDDLPTPRAGGPTTTCLRATRRRVQVRDLAAADWPRVWPIVEEVIRAGETFPYDCAMTSAQARGIWVVEPPGRTVVAVDGGRVVGTAHMHANRPGPGSHVSTASFIVAPDARGQGIGTLLCRNALDWARRRGFAAMQFNAVAASNQTALHLYRQLGFEIVGTVPRAFDHPTLGPVGLHVLYQAL